MVQIVKVNVAQLVAPTPNNLQQTGAVVSQGGTTLAAGTSQYLPNAAALSTLLASALALASLTWAGGTATATLANTTASAGTYNSTSGLVTLTLAANIGATPGQIVYVSGATGTGSFASIDGTFPAAVGSGGTTLEYTVATGLTMTISGAAVSLSTGLATSAVFSTTIAGASPAVYNGTYQATNGANGTTFTYALASDGGTTPATGSITATPGTQAELSTFVADFFAQGGAIGLYVLELGQGTPAAGVTALTAYINANVGQSSPPPVGANPRFYTYGLPSTWALESTAYAMAKLYTANNARVYFYLDLGTIDAGAYTNWLGIKSVAGWSQDPAVASITTEADAAMQMYQVLSLLPSNVNKATPFNYRFLIGATALNPDSEDQAILAASFINYVDTGAEGGISNVLTNGGRLMDGNPILYWYSADWMQINQEEALAAAVIQWNNNPSNPLYYNQAGINSLQAVSNGVNTRAVAYGLANGNPQTTAVPFLLYTQTNPSDYQAGIYNGLALTFTPQTGFDKLTFNLTVSQLAPTS